MKKALHFLFETWDGGFVLGLLGGFVPLVLDELGVISLA